VLRIKQIYNLGKNVDLTNKKIDTESKLNDFIA
jgi:hypothetical protein